MIFQQHRGQVKKVYYTKINMHCTDPISSDYFLGPHCSCLQVCQPTLSSSCFSKSFSQSEEAKQTSIYNSGQLNIVLIFQQNQCCATVIISLLFSLLPKEMKSHQHLLILTTNPIIKNSFVNLKNICFDTIDIMRVFYKVNNFTLV